MLLSLNDPQLWYYVQPYFPNEDFNSVPEYVILPTEAIISLSWNHWVTRMTALNRDTLITVDNCIKDFLTTNWADKMNKEDLRNTLTNSADPVRIRFHKKDGNERIMYCTLNQDLIPIDLVSYGSKSREYEEMLTVYDVEADGWRTVNFNGVVDILEDDHLC
jgi:hypothetical protein